ncbi:MAG: hypothetical protein JSV05_07505 [Candidatus Bathyarchaeota archaeon]|nr:MAG: hypothetical protein JSV05_07505 [Candidatus Bathyarchaeota archaeon]
MKIRISSMVNIILGVILVVSIASLSTSAVDYDPLLDVTVDGYGGIDDIVIVAEHFGASGSPINWTQVLENITALEDRVTSLEEQVSSGAMHVESGEFDGEVNTDMVEDSGANTVFNFQSPFTTTAKPEMVIMIVLKQAADGLWEGAAIKVVEDIKGAANNWTGFDLTVSKYSGGSISDTTQVYVIWLAVGSG